MKRHTMHRVINRAVGYAAALILAVAGVSSFLLPAWLLASAVCSTVKADKCARHVAAEAVLSCDWFCEAPR